MNDDAFNLTMLDVVSSAPAFASLSAIQFSIMSLWLGTHGKLSSKWSKIPLRNSWP